eukprot:181499_1
MSEYPKDEDFMEQNNENGSYPPSEQHVMTPRTITPIPVKTPSLHHQSSSSLHQQSASFINPTSSNSAITPITPKPPPLYHQSSLNSVVMGAVARCDSIITPFTRQNSLVTTANPVPSLMNHPRTPRRPQQHINLAASSSSGNLIIFNNRTSTNSPTTASKIYNFNSNPNPRTPQGSHQNLQILNQIWNENNTQKSQSNVGSESSKSNQKKKDDQDEDDEEEEEEDVDEDEDEEEEDDERYSDEEEEEEEEEDIEQEQEEEEEEDKVQQSKAKRRG